jgi:hypothetical protein
MKLPAMNMLAAMMERPPNQSLRKPPNTLEITYPM